MISAQFWPKNSSPLPPVSVAWNNWEYYYSIALRPQAAHLAEA